MISFARTLGFLTLAGALWSASFDIEVFGFLIFASAVLFGATIIASAIARLPSPLRAANLEARVVALSVEHDDLSAALKSLEAIVAALKAADAAVAGTFDAPARLNPIAPRVQKERGGDNVRRLFEDRP